MKPQEILSVASAVLGGIFGFLFGQADGLLFTLIAFSLLDYATGVTVAAINKKLSSKTGFRGICKKLIILTLVAAANIIDVQILGGTAALRSAVLFVFIANEGVSIIENAAALGIPIPSKLKSVLEQLKSKGENDE